MREEKGREGERLSEKAREKERERRLREKARGVYSSYLGHSKAALRLSGSLQAPLLRITGVCCTFGGTGFGGFGGGDLPEEKVREGMRR